MHLRGYADRTPIGFRLGRTRWPDVFVTPPLTQYALLQSKYTNRKPGRIPLPRSAQDLWAHHKYSVLARDRSMYVEIGRRVSRMRRGTDASTIAEALVLILREPPPTGCLTDAIEHMWGHVSRAATIDERFAAQRSTAERLSGTCELAVRTREPYLMMSTALSDLAVFARPKRQLNALSTLAV
jgi:Protein of unknown function (DUF1722)